MTLTITTYDWVPEFPRGYVRDIRARWACEEAGLPYQIDTVPLRGKTAEHLARQPFQQVPMLRDGELSLFESGAITLYLAERSPVLMPEDPGGRAEVLQWAFAALNTIEVPVTGWLVTEVFNKDKAGGARWAEWMDQRLGQLDAVLAGRDHIAAGRFTAADILLTEALRPAEGEDRTGAFPAITAYLARMTARPAFRKALADQMAHFAAADARDAASPA